MSAINLKVSMKKIKECYVGKDRDGALTIIRNKLMDNLAFDVALSRIGLAIKNKELTEQELLDFLEEK